MNPRIAFLRCVCVLISFVGGASLTQAKADTSAGTAMTSAAITFLESLSPEQRTKAERRFDDPERSNWHYVPNENRKGLGLLDLNPSQRERAMQLLKASLSPAGYEKAVTCMQLDAIIRQYEKNSPLRDSERYYFTLFGTPSLQSQWGLSVEGHHLSCNFVITSGMVTCATPMMFGANPALVTDNKGVGPSSGTRMLAQEEDLAVRLIRSLQQEQRTLAVVTKKSPMDMHEGGKAQTESTNTQGISCSRLGADQKQLMREFIKTVLNNAPSDVAGSHLQQAEKDLDETWFAWLGGTAADQPHSCRVIGPSLLILFYKTQGDAAGNPVNHTHVLWRTPGRDFGAGGASTLQ